MNYNIAGAKREAEEFFWHIFCDDYLEIIKKRIYNEKGDKRLSAQYVLYESLLAILKMMAPITPFITEEIYQTHYKKIEKDKSIHISKWPEVKIKSDKNLEKTGNLFLDVLHKVRKLKSEKSLSMKKEIILILEKNKFKDMLDDLRAVTNAIEIKEGKFKVEFE